MLYLWVVITGFLLFRNIKRFHPSTYSYYIEKIHKKFKERQFMKIVFVCTGNACRSAAAEVVLKKMIKGNGITGVEVASCGTKVNGYLERDEVMCRIATEKGYAMGGMAIQATEEILNSADLIIVMSDNHRNEVTRLLKFDHWHRIVRFNDYCFGEHIDLPDPHYQTEYVYRTCFDTIEKGCVEIMKKLSKDRWKCE